MKKILFLFLSLFATQFLFGQKTGSYKYPSLLWEITGNGLQKPSYLFGTMHVSSKIAFHLSDSVYKAIAHCDMVSLELNPQSWQPEMYKMEQAAADLYNYTSANRNIYFNEKSFQLSDYTDALKYALSQEASQVNNLLYRTYSSEADFEENTYLDLYIYQTGRKLGKKGAGVEDYMQSQKLMIDAYAAAAAEKKKNKTNSDDISPNELEGKIQDAYRAGDLDLLDSFTNLRNSSEAFNEIFIYKRNQIQANSIDSLLKQNSLFVGVGAAHLPGDRGVIELLRKKGYKLRPVKIANSDASDKEKIDKMKVPVVMKPFTTADGFIQLSLPGPLYNRNNYDRVGNESSQYADMENGSYYMLTRVKTHAGLLGQSEEDVLKRVDSLLYENIPGEILKKSKIVKNGYKGFDITNKTRRGDVQRYNILVTPYEIIVIKMSGNNDYVNGSEADHFFNSVTLKENSSKWQTYTPSVGGFKALLPQQPHINFAHSFISQNTIEYEADDSTAGSAYAVWKKNVSNSSFIEEDTFNLSLMEASLLGSDIIDKQLTRSIGIQDGYHTLTMKFSLKSGGVLRAKAIERGPEFYFLLARSKDSSAAVSSFFNGFQLTDYNYAAANLYNDTVLKFSVQSVVKPSIDTIIRNMTTQSEKSEKLTYGNNSYNYWDKKKWAVFTNDTSGETIDVIVQVFPKYYYQTDTAEFWKNRIGWDRLYDNFIVQNKQYFVHPKDSVCGYTYSLLDTNSITKIKVLVLLKANRLYSVFTVTDTLREESSFIKQFFASFKPTPEKGAPSIFKNKLNFFFGDYYSKDSATHKQAQDVISNITYNREGFDRIKQAIFNLKITDKDYFETKEKFIAEIGYISDSAGSNKSTEFLKELYGMAGDTSSFQTPILKALARLQTKASFDALKTYLVQDPPILDNAYRNDEDIFRSINDTLALAKNLFPDILQLASLDDYKKPVTDLLVSLVDSSYLKEADYESYYTKIYFDAKVELKKQQQLDQKSLEKDENDDNSSTRVLLSHYYSHNHYNPEEQKRINNYATLLMPFYDKYPTVPKFFEKLLQSKALDVRLFAAIKMLQNNKPLPDSTLPSLAANDKYRSKLLSELERIKKKSLFPVQYKKQESLAKSILLNQTESETFSDIQTVGKKFVQLKDTSGFAYLFKYKLQKDDDWKMGISGLQPIDSMEANSNDEIAFADDKNIQTANSEAEQFDKKLKELILSTHKSAAYFFTSHAYNYSNNAEDGDATEQLLAPCK